MKKINNLNFEIKKELLISINNCLIDDDKFDKSNLNFFEEIFTYVPYYEFDLHVYLYNVWNDIKRCVELYYNKNNNLLERQLRLINLKLQLMSNHLDSNKVKVKVNKNGE